jgi:signal transduction histidine kinase
VRGITPPPLEHRIIHKDGGIRWIRNTSVPHKDNQARVIAYDGVICDITERKLAEHRLKRASAELCETQDTLRQTLGELKASHRELRTSELELIQASKMEAVGTLTAGVAHEVKNPLQTLLLGLHYLEHHVPAENENVTRTLHDMRDAVTRANSIVGELLQFSAAGELDMKEDDFNAVVERSLSLMNYELTTSQIAVTRHLDAGLPPVKMAPGKMEQVFLNLFMNAVQAMWAGGTLTVRTRAAQFSDELVENRRADCPFKAGEHIVIAEVQDTGVGIPEVNLSKIFDPFFTTKPAGIGTGLGLSVIQKIIELHGGSIDIQNAPPGGVNVTLMLKNGVRKKMA